MEAYSRQDFERIRIDKDSDLIAITVRQYKFFLKHGPEGRDGCLLYIHLVFTARLQETNQVKANDFYICNGLLWGKEKTKRVKAWLVRNGLISYVWIRNHDGTLAEMYIKINFLLSHLYKSSDCVQGEVTIGMESLPTVEPAYGCETQMLKEININSLSVDEEAISRSICEKWYSAYSKYSKRNARPKNGDYSVAVQLIRDYPELGECDGAQIIDKAVQYHFEKWNFAWFLIVDATRPLPESSHLPYWNFRNFCNFFLEILNLETIDSCKAIEKNTKSRKNTSVKRGTGLSAETREAIIRKIENERKGDKK